jgi:hypothetical protein
MHVHHTLSIATYEQSGGLVKGLVSGLTALVNGVMRKEVCMRKRTCVWNFVRTLET